MATFVPEFLQVLKQNGQSGKHVWNTETEWGSYNANRHLDDPDLQAAWIARMYILSASYHIARLYWFSWSDPGLGTLWEPDPNNPGAPGTLLKPGIAYGQVYNWIVGSDMTQPCAPSGSTWSCSFTRLGGFEGAAVWDTSQTCANSECTTKPYTVDPKYVKYLTVLGETVPIKGSTVPVGAQPIFLENQ